MPTRRDPPLPEIQAKIVQICIDPEDGTLYGLDEDGDTWRKHETKSEWEFFIDAPFKETT